MSAELLTTRISIESVTIIQQRNFNIFNVNCNILRCYQLLQNHLSDIRVQRQQTLYKKNFLYDILVDTQSVNSHHSKCLSSITSLANTCILFYHLQNLCIKYM